MIELQEVFYAYPGSPGVPVLDGLELRVRPAETIMLAGASGSGKSTLAFLLGGLIPHFLGGSLKGRALLENLDLSLHPPSELLSHVGLVMQNADAQLFNPTVRQELAFGLESLGLPEGEILRRIQETSDRFGLGHLLGRTPTDLSGGEKRLVGIAALACMPCPTLVLDEPLAHLDEPSVEKVKQVLRKIRSEGRTILIAEHRVQALLEEVDRCVILERGKVCFEGSPRQARQELARVGLIPSYAAKPKRKFAGAQVVLEVRDLHKSLGGRQVLKGVSFQLHQGEILAVQGPNGAGKSTLIKHLNGLLRPDKGQVLLHGEPIQGKDPSSLACHVGIVFQNPNDQFFCSLVREEILASPRSKKFCSAGKLESICDTLGLGPLLERSPYRLSEGEKRRVAIGSVLAMGSPILVLDEPTAGQDGRSRMELARMLYGLQAQGTSILMVTHDRSFAQALADRCLEMAEGCMIPSAQAMEGLAGWGTRGG